LICLSCIGDWELDTIIGQGQQPSIVLLTEGKTAQCLSKAIMKLWSPIPDPVLTRTLDHGTEFADHKNIAHQFKVSFHFAHPDA